MAAGCRRPPPALCLGIETGRTIMASETFEIEKSEAEWRQSLSPEQFRGLRQHGTEGARTSPLDKPHAARSYAFAGWGEPLFSSDAKFASGTRSPTFSAPPHG